MLVDRHIFFPVEATCMGADECPHLVTIVHVALFPDLGAKAVWYCEEHGRHAAAQAERDYEENLQ